jgi:hypothetical protein
MVLLWALALAISGLLVIRFASCGAIVGIVVIWGTGIVTGDESHVPRNADHVRFAEVIWISGVGGLAGAAWTLPILVARGFVSRRKRLRRDCAGKSA